MGRVVVRPAKLPEPQELPSGYLKHSAPPKIADICHEAQPFYNNKKGYINMLPQFITMLT